jgi:hypothetical protein
VTGDRSNDDPPRRRRASGQPGERPADRAVVAPPTASLPRSSANPRGRLPGTVTLPASPPSRVRGPMDPGLPCGVRRVRFPRGSALEPKKLDGSAFWFPILVLKTGFMVRFWGRNVVNFRPSGRTPATTRFLHFTAHAFDVVLVFLHFGELR